MQIGMIGLGRMGANMGRRLLRGGHQCVAYDADADARATLQREGASTAATLAELAAALPAPRTVWLMVPAGAVDTVLAELVPLLQSGDVVIDGGNSMYHDDIRRGAELGERGIHYLDVGTSGGTAGLERGYCLMIGGDAGVVRRLQPLFATLAPGVDAAPRSPGRNGPPSTAEQGYLHCGPVGAGHFVKMVHNGIEYGLMGAYAEGINLLRHANAGSRTRAADAETTPLRQPELYRYDFDLAEIAELWRRGSVVGSWLLDLAAAALHDDPALDHFGGRVSDSGEGRWTVAAAIDTAVPVPILSAALFERFGSRGNADFGDRLLSALRYRFGGHLEKRGGGHE
ncbi:MAG: decarboxylating 6-phosphogluconate dehydrogenase [Burkholderiaceae bacterium]